MAPSTVPRLPPLEQLVRLVDFISKRLPMSGMAER
jgi:hypothetical protein